MKSRSANGIATKIASKSVDNGQRTEHVKRGHVKTDRCRGHFRGHFRGHPRGTFRGAFRGGVLEGLKQRNEHSWALSWAHSWAPSWALSWTHSWAHSWTHSWGQISRFACSAILPDKKINIGTVIAMIRIAVISNSGWLRNRTGTENRHRRNLNFVPKPKAEPPEPLSRNRNRKRNRPCLLSYTETQKNPVCRGTVGTENRNRWNRSMHEP